jgi:zinc protease
MNRYLCLIGLLLILLTACVGTATVPQVRPDQLSFPPLQFNFPAVEKQQLDNGIKLYLKEDHELPLVELTLTIAGGSIHDPPGKTGLSHLFAELLETGGAGDLSPAELETELEGMAAELSVSSSTYSYQIDLSLQQRDLQRGIEILSDLLRRPRFDEARLELSRKQLLDGIRRENDDPGSIAARVLAEAVFPGHPFGASPKIPEVETFSRADLLALYQRYFHPENLWVAVSGDVDRAEIVRLLQQHLGDWPSGAVALPPLPQLPAASNGKILVVDKAIPQTTILMGHEGISKDNPDMYALQVANYILGGGGFNSRMMSEIRSNRGLAYSVYSYFQVGRWLPKQFIAGSETKTGTTAEVVTLMRKAIQQLIDQPVSTAELELAKQSLINSFVFAFTDTHSIVNRAVRIDYYQYPEGYLENYQRNLAAVTIADVQRVARQYLHPERLQIVLVGDSGKFLDSVKELGLPVEKVSLNSGLLPANGEGGN